MITRAGKKPLLHEATELQLYNHIVESQRFGMPKSRNDILRDAWLLATINHQEDVFGSEGPTKGFLQSFLSRHPDLVLRKSEALSHAAAGVSARSIKNWFCQIKNAIVT